MPGRKPKPEEVTDRQVRRKLIGDEDCHAGVYARIPVAMRDALHAEAKRRGIGLNTLCLIAFLDVLPDVYRPGE